jgi:hypothetical protein
MKTSLPASILKTNDVIDFLNSPGQSFWNGGLQDLCSVSNFFQYGLELVSTKVSNAVWVNAGGKAQLNYTLTTVSDPVTAQQINASLWLMIGVAVTAIGALLILIPVGGWAVDLVGAILVAAGVLTILDIGVIEVSSIFNEIGQIFSSPAGKILEAGIGIAIIAGVGLFVYGVATSEKAKQNVRNVAEYTTGKAAEYTPKVAHAAGTVVGQAYSTAKAYAPQVASAVKSTASKAYNYVTQ